MLLHQFLERSAERTPESIAVIEPSRSVTFGELDRMAKQFALLLRSYKVRRGDRVVLALDNCIELVAAYFGSLKAGAVAVPLPPGPRSDRLARAIVDCAPAVAVVDPATALEMTEEGLTGSCGTVLVHRDSRRAVRPDSLTTAVDLREALAGVSESQLDVTVIDLDLAAIIYTSGSTGVPRGVMLRHSNIVANTCSIVSYLGLTASDRAMCVLPLYYVYGLSLLHTHIAIGGSIVLDNRFTYPNVVLESMQRHAVTGFAGVPSTFALLLHRSRLAEMEFPALRYVTQAGGGMSPARITEWLERGPKVPFYVMYGATEASARLTYLAPCDLQRKLGSIGRAIPNTEVLVVKDDGEIAAPGEIGELVARGANVACGYWNNPAETADKFGPLGYRTGDLGYADDEGFLYLVGRRHDMIKVGAHRVGSKEIEDVLHEFPGVDEAAVVGAPHELLGEVPVAFVTMRQNVQPDGEAIRAFCGSRLAAHKVPARVVLSSELPRTSGAGKIDKIALLSRAAS